MQANVAGAEREPVAESAMLTAPLPGELEVEAARDDRIPHAAGEQHPNNVGIAEHLLTSSPGPRPGHGARAVAGPRGFLLGRQPIRAKGAKGVQARPAAQAFQDQDLRRRPRSAFRIRPDLTDFDDGVEVGVDSMVEDGFDPVCAPRDGLM
jgi:hypothetical protein